MTALVSIVIPCHNAAAWLAETLESALAQTWPEKEVILIDDGSADGSLEIARSFESRGVRVLTQANRGASAARNAGLREARGDFIQFLDADDLLAPDKVERQIDAAANMVAASLFSARWGRFQSDPAEAVFVPERNWRSMPSIDWLSLSFAGEGMMVPAAWLVPRVLIEAAGPWEESLTLNDDGEYFCRVALAANAIVFCPEAVCFYRSGNANSLSHRHTAAAWESAWRSQLLCQRHLLGREDSPRTRKACAHLFQRLAYAAYADAPMVACEAEKAAAALGGSSLRPGGGTAFRLLVRLAGWKAAVRLKHRLGNRN